MGFTDYLFGAGQPLFENFFKGKTEKVPGPQIKETPWAPEVRRYLQNLMGQNVRFPTRQVPGITTTEQQAQGVLSNLLAGGTFEDPAKSQYYRGLREESQAEEDRAVNQLRRRQQKMGMFASTPGVAGEGRLRNQFANQRNQILGGLYESERARDNPYTRLAAVQQYGGLPRQIETEQAGANYQTALQNLTFPYQTQAQLANLLMNYQPWYQPQYYQQPSQFAQIAGPLSGLMQGAGMLMI